MGVIAHNPQDRQRGAGDLKEETEKPPGRDHGALRRLSKGGQAYVRTTDRSSGLTKNKLRAD